MTIYTTNISPTPGANSFDCTLTSKFSLSCTLNKITTYKLSNRIIADFHTITCNALSVGSSLDPGYNNSICYDDFFTLSCPIPYTINNTSTGTTAIQNVKVCIVNIPQLSFLTELATPNLQINPNADFTHDISNYIDMKNLLQGLIYTATNNNLNSS